MSKLFWNVLKLCPIVVAATLFVGNSAFAAPSNGQDTSVTQLSQESNQLAQESNNLGQVTSVSQFSDVQPTDWAFQALQSLVERYGCIAGYPNGTYRGNRAMTRYEFAAGLNACLNRVNELIATSTADLVKKEDLATLQRLQEEYKGELATLRGRVDNLEARTAELKAQQFSTTTKLKGEAIFSVSDAFGDRVAVSSSRLVNSKTPGTTAKAGGNLNSNAVFSDRVRLNLLTSFTGKDQLQLRLQARNTINNIGATGTSQTRLAYDVTNNTSSDLNNNQVEIDKINYAFNITKDIRAKIDANQGEYYENINTFNPDFASSGTGALSYYGRFSPIYRQGQGGAGVTLSYNSKKSPVTFDVGYLAGSGNNPVPGTTTYQASNPGLSNGLTDGSFAAIAQLGFKPTKAFNLGLTYARTYQPGGNNLFQGTGSDLANNPFYGTRTSSDNFGIEALLSPSSSIDVGGWVGYSSAQAQANNVVTNVGGVAGNTANVKSGDNADLFYYGVTLALKDVGRKGNVLGFIFGQQPKVTGSSLITTNGARQKEKDTSYQLEGQYRMLVNDHISFTPGLIVIFNPENNNNNTTTYVGTVRTTFTF